MPLARHDALAISDDVIVPTVSTHMPLARHDPKLFVSLLPLSVSTHMPLARHDILAAIREYVPISFYSHASCEA